VVAALRLNRKAWVDFMMRFELGLEIPDPKRAMKSALTIGGAYIAGGLIPLLPYMLLGTLAAALKVSVLATLLALLAFGFVKAKFTGSAPSWSEGWRPRPHSSSPGPFPELPKGDPCEPGVGIGFRRLGETTTAGCGECLMEQP
jgi:hypothetical protein